MQKELNDLQAQGVKLSQYDVDAARKRFELEMARQQLEDARNNRSEVRLQRDANGNWGYVYTAAEDEVADAEQEYENKLYEYQKLNDDYINELQSRVLEVQQQYSQQVAEIYNDTTLTDDQRQARLDELNRWKEEELNYFQQQLQNALDNQRGTLDLYYSLYGDEHAQLADDWEETTLRMLTGASSVSEYIDGVRTAMLEMLDGAAAAFAEYDKDEREASEAAGIKPEDYATEVTEAITAIGTQSEETKGKVHLLAEELAGEFTTSLQGALQWEEEYASKINAAVEANEAFIQTLNEMIARLAVLESSNPELKAARAAYMAAEAEHERKVSAGEIDKDAVDEDWEKAKRDWNDYINEHIAQFDTGGYTGSWGSNGKLAILHEQEAVFNRDQFNYLIDYLRFNRERDDYNRLINLLEDRIQTSDKDNYNILLDRFQMQQQDMIHEFMDYIIKELDFYSGRLNSVSLIPDALDSISDLSNTLDQEVHIDANFPSVQDHNEIEIALQNLVNKASQYANRKNMSAMTFNDMYTGQF